MTDDGKFVFQSGMDSNEIDVFKYNPSYTSNTNRYTALTTLTSSIATSNAPVKMGAFMGLFESSDSGAYNKNNQLNNYEMILLDGESTANAITNHTNMDFYNLTFQETAHYTNKAFPFTHKGFTFNINNLPNSTTGLVSGDLYVDTNGFVKIKT
jgi:hypothetical protein